MPVDRSPAAATGLGEGGPEVEALHRALMREPPEPVEGREAVPAWLWALTAALLFVGGFYLGRYGGDIGLETHRTVPGEGGAAPGEGAGAAPVELPVSGAAVFAGRCAACHQATGVGVPGAFPPLVGSEWVTGDPSVPVRIVLRGLQGPITVAGQPYQGVMPPWADLLTDAEIAAVVTHVRQLAGVPDPAVTPEAVAALRAESEGAGPYTADQLRGGAP